MKRVIPEIYVSDCKNAIEFYRELFGGSIKKLTMSDDLPLFSEYRGLVVHSELHVNRDCVFYFVDVLGEAQERPGNVILMLHMSGPDELDRVFARLSDGGQVGMSPQTTRHGEYHAIVTDRFGAPWALHSVGRGQAGDPCTIPPSEFV